MKRPLRATALIVAVSALSAMAQDPQERRRFLEPETPVSDDPRRVPVSEPEEDGRVLVLRGGNVFDGTGAPLRAATIVTRGKTIDRLESPDVTSWPEDAEVIDIDGKTVLPGLVDLHTHLTYYDPDSSPERGRSVADATLRASERLRYYIESGITSIRDVASAGDIPFVLKQWVAENRVVGPRIFAAGQLITATGGHGAEGQGNILVETGSVMTASGPDEWREAVRKQFDRGADLIKLASHYSREEIAAAIEEAHALGLKVTVDAETFYVQWAVEAGADSIEHPLPRTEETVRMMAETGTASVPTLIPYIYIIDASGGYFGSTSRRFTMTKDSNLAMLRTLREAGVKLGVGTDLVVDWYRYLPHPYITELKQLEAAGYTPSEALVAATKTSAEILDMAHRLGTIEPGKLADLVVIDGRPDRNLEDLEKVDLVIRDGHVIVREGRIWVPRHVPESPERPTEMR
ncbi:MAG TPA: amidohydrolase family protein [Vicinamibacteria bacterium]|nr:amidohydrolase family protein [Vicinamibacteria bacterium]